MNDPKDIFGFIRTDLICTLPYEHAKPFLNEEVNKEEWELKSCPRPTGVLAEMKKYMNFAWDKANNCRGLSACRSLMHMQAWLWLLGEDEVSIPLPTSIHATASPNYGLSVSITNGIGRRLTTVAGRRRRRRGRSPSRRDVPVENVMTREIYDFEKWSRQS